MNQPLGEDSGGSAGAVHFWAGGRVVVANERERSAQDRTVEAEREEKKRSNSPNSDAVGTG